MARNIANLTGLQASVLLDPRRGPPGGRAGFIQDRQQRQAHGRALMEQRGIPLPAVGASRPLTPLTTPAVTNMGSVTPPRSPFTSGLVAPAGTQLPPRNGTTGGTAPQIIDLSGAAQSPALFSQTLKDIMRNILMGTGNQNLINAGQETAGGLLALPEELGATPGFAGLNLSQAQRLSSIKEAGLGSMLEGIGTALQGRRDRVTELVNTASDILKEQIASAERIAEENKAQGISPEENIRLEQSLRKEFTDSAKDFEIIRDSYGRIIASAKTPSAAGDLSLMFNYMKLLDPKSVVRESEFAQVAASGSLGEQFKGFVNKLLEGTRLSDIVRKDFVDRANMLYEVQQAQHKLRTDEFTRIAENSGLDPANIILDLSLAGGGIATTSPTSANTVTVKGADGNYYTYDLSDPAQSANYQEGLSVGFFTK